MRLAILSAPASRAMGAPDEKRFAALRRRYLARKTKLDAREGALRVKYGELQISWLTRAERLELERLRAGADAAGDAFFAYLKAISPRDWSYGVPVHWLYEALTYEDAIRPATETLSVVPPLSYGAAAARR